MSLNATIEYYLHCIWNITHKISKSQKYADQRVNQENDW